jgi:hypothetical protein
MCAALEIGGKRGRVRVASRNPREFLRKNTHVDPERMQRATKLSGVGLVEHEDGVVRTFFVARRAASVRVGIRDRWGLGVNDARDALHIDATRGHIRRDKCIDIATLEGSECAVSLGLPCKSVKVRRRLRPPASRPRGDAAWWRGRPAYWFSVRCTSAPFGGNPTPWLDERVNLLAGRRHPTRSWPRWCRPRDPRRIPTR